jgi:signal transduction histidine kinase
MHPSDAGGDSDDGFTLEACRLWDKFPKYACLPYSGNHHVFPVVAVFAQASDPLQYGAPSGDSVVGETVRPCSADAAQIIAMTLTAAGTLTPPPAPADAHERGPRLVASELALLRFVAGMRAMLALLTGLTALAHRGSHDPTVHVVLLTYLAWAAVLLWKTLHGWPQARWRLWLWLDACAVLTACQLMAQGAPLLGIVLVLPVVAMALLAGVAHATVLAVVCTAALLMLSGLHRTADSPPPLPLLVPVLLVAFGPMAALLVRPSRALQQRRQLLDAFNERLDPRQGLRHHVDVLLQLLANHLNLSVATLSLQGLEPRIFEWRAGQAAQVLNEPDVQLWRERLAKLQHELGCICASDGHGSPRVMALDPQSGRRAPVSEAVRLTLLDIGAQALALPLQSYGQPLGHLCLRRAEGAFGADELRWLHNVMRETLPLLERSDLLEQLQRETAARERERIGRDLHDSAVQPYLGLKYGLEALARLAGPDNPISAKVGQLVQMANEELQTLRDVVSGLRSGQDTSCSSASLSALQRQVKRFEALYGLKVQVFAPAALELRGSAAKAVLHMVNEALTNVRRHTSATAVTILFDVRQASVVLRLRNDHGRGEALAADFVPCSLSERAAEFGGGVVVAHESNFTEIAITLPMVGAIG